MKDLITEVRGLYHKAHASASAERALVKRVPELCDALEKSQKEVELITKMYAKTCEDKCLLDGDLEQAKEYIKELEDELRWASITKARHCILS